MKRRHFLSSTTSSVLGAGLGLGLPLLSVGSAYAAETAPMVGGSVIGHWNHQLLQLVRANGTPPPIAARAMAMLNEATYNAWAVWDDQAAFTVQGLPKYRAAKQASVWQELAIHQAARDVLVDVFPKWQDRLDVAFRLVVASGSHSDTFHQEALKVGAQAASGLLARRHRDGSNQMGDMNEGAAYSDWTGYQSVNQPNKLQDPMQWEPLLVTSRQGAQTVQKYLTPHWGFVKPFALKSGAALRPSMAHLVPTQDEMQELLRMSAELDNTTKSIADYWAGGPGTVTPPGLWMQIAAQAAAVDHNTLAQDVKLYFTVSQSLFDASIAAWDAKRTFQSCRPISAIRRAFAGQEVMAWAGPNQGSRRMRADDWLPYQALDFVTPPFPEFVSGHSTFSAAAAAALSATRGEKLEITGQVTAESGPVETLAPQTLRWSTVWEAADSAGISRRFGGIHFEQGDLVGRALGRRVGEVVAQRCQALFQGRDGVA